MAGGGFTRLPVDASAGQGEPIWVLSHAGGRFYTLTTGMISGYFKWPSSGSRGGPLRTLRHVTADFAAGSSGAPVFNEHGAVVGIAEETQTLAGSDDQVQMIEKHCIPSSLLLKLTRTQ